MEEKIRLVWEMTEKQFDDFKKDSSCKRGHRSGPWSESADYYGSVKIGDVCIDLQHTLDASDWYAFANVFILGIDDGYGYTDNGTPYTLLDVCPEVPIRCKTFTSFKSKFGTNIIKMLNENPELKQYAYKPTANWN